MQQNTVLITSSRTWTVPDDWSNVNKIEVVGSGGSGGKGSFIVNQFGGGFLLYYALGGAGGGYSSVTNLKNLLPGQTITVVIGAGGAAGADFGSAGNSTTFGNVILGGGAMVLGNYPQINHFGGGSQIFVATENYTNYTSVIGQNRIRTGQQLVDIPAGRSGSIGTPISGYGDGGRGEKLGTGAWPAASGRSGAVYISYEPSGTHQACVWIS